ncbi:MAG: hypothetical protein JRM99_09430 [Nitrososphaerota archaeon]|nr:hypothetical protein [Nitrososphaerota archaeon]
MFDLGTLFSPAAGLTVGTIVAMAYILGLLHGITPDEHTWPITFSYSVGSYSTRGGMKAGFVFSTGFTIQRAILTTLGFVGLAAVYKTYSLDGPVYIVVGVVMFIAGSYILKGRYIHLPIDALLGREHHSTDAQRVSLHESSVRPVPLRMAIVHGFIAGWGFGAYASIITFILAPQLPSLVYAPLPGLAFGVGTMCMQIIIGSVFANIMRVKHLTEEQIKYIGKSTAGRALYYGGLAFAVIGGLIAAFPLLDQIAISTGNPIPNLSSIGVSTILVIGVVGVIGLSSMFRGYKEIVIAQKKGPAPANE